MKVVMKLSVSTVDASYGAAGEYDLPELLANQWIKAGYAEAVEAEIEEPVAVEEPTAVEQPVEAEAPAAPAPRRGRKSRVVEAPKPDLL
jgi:hypothetical protein